MPVSASPLLLLSGQVFPFVQRSWGPWVRTVGLMADVTFLVGAADYTVADDEAAALAYELSNRYIPAAPLGAELASAMCLAVDICLHLGGAATDDVIDLGSTDIRVLATILDQRCTQEGDLAHEL